MGQPIAGPRCARLRRRYGAETLSLDRRAALRNDIWSVRRDHLQHDRGSEKTIVARFFESLA